MSETSDGLVKIVAPTFDAAPPASRSIGGLLRVDDSGEFYISRVVDGVPQWLDVSDPFAGIESSDVEIGLQTVRITAPSLDAARPAALAGGGLLKVLDTEEVFQAVLVETGWAWLPIDDMRAINTKLLTNFAMSYTRRQLDRLNATFDFTPTSAPPGAAGGEGIWTWEIPPWVKRFRVEALGSGAGGASGPVGPSGLLRIGGIGGAGGGMSVVEVNADDLPSRNLAITVPGGGTGGAAVATNDTMENPGLPGASAIVASGEQVIAYGYGGGEAHGAHIADARNAQLGGSGWVNTNSAAIAPAAPADLGPYQFGNGGAPGGGGGGGIAANDAVIIALPGVTAGPQPTTALVPAGSTAGASGGNAPTATQGFVGGSGGGGAAGDASHHGGSGGSATAGGGGGGGGAAPNGRQSGAGGTGGPAHVRIAVLRV